jgi:aryl-alcohol dehydrogenase-like predicted oxidoreductase
LEYRRLGQSGLTVPTLAFGTATFGGGNEMFRKWGTTDVAEAERLIDICLDAGVDFFDTADAYSGGAAEEILGQALGPRRNRAIIATKAGYPVGAGPNSTGAGRRHLIAACEASLKRLGRDHIDLLQLHGFDELTPVEETLRAFDDLIRSGKVRYIGGSNFSGWQLTKMASTAERLGLPRMVSHQVQYSLLTRDFDHELMPAAYDLGVGTIVWSPLSGGKLSGKFRRGAPLPAESRTAKTGGIGEDEIRLFAIVDILAEIAGARGKSLSQVALNWLLTRPTVTSLAIGARTPEQLIDNLGATDWRLSAEEAGRLDAASTLPAPYPYSHQARFPTLLRPLEPPK